MPPVLIFCPIADEWLCICSTVCTFLWLGFSKMGWHGLWQAVHLNREGQLLKNMYADEFGGF